MTDEIQNYRSPDIPKLGLIDKITCIATLVVCYIITIFTLIIFIALLATVWQDNEHYPLWLWTLLFSIIIYGSIGVVITHVYMINRSFKNGVTFYKFTVAIIVSLLIVERLKED